MLKLKLWIYIYIDINICKESATTLLCTLNIPRNRHNNQDNQDNQIKGQWIFYVNNYSKGFPKERNHLTFPSRNIAIIIEKKTIYTKISHR